MNLDNPPKKSKQSPKREVKGTVQHAIVHIVRFIFKFKYFQNFMPNGTTKNVNNDDYINIVNNENSEIKKEDGAFELIWDCVIVYVSLFVC